MCLIYYRDNTSATSPVNVQALLRAHKQNSDGFGLLAWNNGRWKHRKWESVSTGYLQSLIAKLSDSCEQWAFHFRMATHGEVCRANSHPFWIKSNTYLMHNGVLPAPWSSDRTKSDTLCLVEMLRRCLSGNAIVQDFLPLLKNATSGNRLLITHNSGVHLTGDWKEEKDGYYSNGTCLWSPANTSYNQAWGDDWQSDHYVTGSYRRDRLNNYSTPVGYGSNSSNTLITAGDETWLEIKSPDGVIRWETYSNGRQRTMYTRPQTGKVIEATVNIPVAADDKAEALSEMVDEQAVRKQLPIDTPMGVKDLAGFLPLTSVLNAQLVELNAKLQELGSGTIDPESISIPVYAGIECKDLCGVEIVQRDRSTLQWRGFLLGVQYASWRVMNRLGMETLYRTFKCLMPDGTTGTTITEREWYSGKYSPDVLDVWCWGFHDGYTRVYAAYHTSKNMAGLQLPENMRDEKRTLFRCGLFSILGNEVPFELDDIRTLSSIAKTSSYSCAAQLIKKGLEHVQTLSNLNDKQDTQEAVQPAADPPAVSENIACPVDILRSE
jgi:predicted glutamine amidotransferase